MGIVTVGVGQGVLVGVDVFVGIDAPVATTPASMVAGKSGVVVGNAANTIAWTVASRSGSGVGVCVEMGAGADAVGGLAAITVCVTATAWMSVFVAGVESSHAISRARVADTKTESVVKRARVIKPFFRQMSMIGENRPVRWYGNA